MITSPDGQLSCRKSQRLCFSRVRRDGYFLCISDLRASVRSNQIEPCAGNHTNNSGKHRVTSLIFAAPGLLPPIHHASMTARRHANMTTIAIVSQKGGVGKTTLAVNLAQAADAAGLVSLVIDMDPQETAYTWGQWRKGRAPEVIRATPDTLEDTRQGAYDSGADIIVIDTPPNAEAAVRDAIFLADRVLIPVRPRAFDLQAITATAALVRARSVPAWVIFNAMPARAPRLLQETTKFVRSMGLPVFPHTITDLAAFHRAADVGAAASELQPNSRAAAEIAAIWEYMRDGKPSRQLASKLAGHQVSSAEAAQ